jgi:hypothetical protein
VYEHIFKHFLANIVKSRMKQEDWEINIFVHLHIYVHPVQILGI